MVVRDCVWYCRVVLLPIFLSKKIPLSLKSFYLEIHCEDWEFSGFLRHFARLVKVGFAEKKTTLDIKQL